LAAETADVGKDAPKGFFEEAFAERLKGKLA
jgi:hypothetical protein